LGDLKIFAALESGTATESGVTCSLSHRRTATVSMGESSWSRRPDGMAWYWAPLPATSCLLSYRLTDSLPCICYV